VPDGGGNRPARDLAVGDLDASLDLIGEPAETAAEDDTDPRLEIGPLADPENGVVEAQTDPSATRSS
jgi:hypothetical protein